MNALQMVVERTPEIRLSHPREYVKQRVADSAHRLNLKGQDRARFEAVSEAMYRATELYYLLDEGRLVNVDSRTYRVRIPAPWGSSGWKHYGLREWEARVLNRMLRQYRGQRPALYQYDRQNWYLNVEDYATFDAAQYWLRHELRYTTWQMVRQAMADGTSKGTA